MNKIVISKEKIVEASMRVVADGGMNALSIRAVAKECGVAVGSIYNYFPTKADLMIAVIAEQWREVFAPIMRKIAGCASFSAMIRLICEEIGKQPESKRMIFKSHATALEQMDLNKGRTAMQEYLELIFRMMREGLERDTDIKENIWTTSYTKEAFISFVLSNLTLCFTREGTSQKFLIETIERILY